MEHIVFWMVVGGVAGFLAKAVLPGERGGGLVEDILVGLIGAVAGGWLFTTVLGHSYAGWIGSTVVAFVGAVALLVVLRALTGRRAAG